MSPGQVSTPTGGMDARCRPSKRPGGALMPMRPDRGMRLPRYVSYLALLLVPLLSLDH
jgi:hypothetical protein